MLLSAYYTNKVIRNISNLYRLIAYLEAEGFDINNLYPIQNGYYLVIDTNNKMVYWYHTMPPQKNGNKDVLVERLCTRIEELLKEE